MAFAWLFIGLALGGGVTLVFLCAIQLGRANEYESETKRLRQELDAIRKDHPELFDEKGRYRKKAGRSRRGGRSNDMLRPCRHCIS